MANQYNAITTRANGQTITADWFNTIKTTLVNNGAVKHNIAGTTAPAVTDDSDSNYEPGSTWTDTTNDNFYVCVDASVGAAVWYEVAFTSTAQTFTDKTLTSPAINGANLNMGTASDTNRILLASDTTTNLDLLTDTAGLIAYDTTLGKVVYNDGTGWTAVGTGSGGGGINHIDNPDAESDTSGWATYDDGASATPVDGTGGSPSTITLSRNTSSPLRTLGDFDIAKTAANGQGEGWSYDFSIDNADKYSVLRITFDYTTSANYVDDEIGIFIYDVTNASLIRVSSEDIKATSNIGHFVSEFQATDSTSYRLIFHLPTTAATAWDFNFDNVSVGPRSVANGNKLIVAEGKGNGGTSITANVTDIDFTETFDNSGSFDGTTFTAPCSGWFQIEGSVLVTATTSTWNINAYIDGTIDKNLGRQESGTLNVFSGNIYLDKGQDLTFRSGDACTLDNNTTFHWVTISASATAMVSEDFGNRDIVASGAGNDGAAFTSSTDINFTETFDNTGSFDGTTFTVPETGEYVITGAVNITASSTMISKLYVNAVDTKRLCQNVSSVLKPIFAIQSLTKGDAVTIRMDSSGTLSNSSTNHYIEFRKLQSPETLYGGEVIAARYSTNASQVISNATVTIIDFEDASFDTFASVTTGASWKFEAERSGIYKIDAQVYTEDADLDGEEEAAIYIYKNGVSYARRRADMQSTVTNVRYAFLISDLVELDKGDYVDIRFYQGSGADVTLGSGGTDNRVSVHKLN